MPAPTIPPMPIETAATMPICPDPRLAAGETLEDLAEGMVMARLARLDFRAKITDNPACGPA